MNFLSSQKISMFNFIFDEIILKILARRKNAERNIGIFSKSDDYIGMILSSQGLYERGVLECVADLVDKRKIGRKIFLDIGANIGNHSVYLSRIFEYVLSFEPNKTIYKVLDANIDLVEKGNIRAFNYGLGEKPQSAYLSIPDSGNIGSGMLVSDGNAENSVRIENGDAVCSNLLDQLAEESREISFVKCDVEGMEADVFRGLAGTLKKHRPAVLFESNSYESGAESWAVLQSYGYNRLFEFQNAGGSPLQSRGLLRLLKMVASPVHGFVESDVPRYPANLLAVVENS